MKERAGDEPRFLAWTVQNRVPIVRVGGRVGHFMRDRDAFYFQMQEA